MTELKPCPFCGGKVSLSEVSFCLELMQFKCADCGTIFRMKDDIWNRRVYPPEVEKAVERMEPRKPIFGIHKKIDLMGFFCPTCEQKINKNNHLYFCKCGQALDWSE